VKNTSEITPEAAAPAQTENQTAEVATEEDSDDMNDLD